MEQPQDKYKFSVADLPNAEISQERVGQMIAQFTQQAQGAADGDSAMVAVMASLLKILQPAALSYRVYPYMLNPLGMPNDGAYMQILPDNPARRFLMVIPSMPLSGTMAPTLVNFDPGPLQPMLIKAGPTLDAFVQRSIPIYPGASNTPGLFGFMPAVAPKNMVTIGAILTDTALYAQGVIIEGV